MFRFDGLSILRDIYASCKQLYLCIVYAEKRDSHHVKGESARMVDADGMMSIWRPLICSHLGDVGWSS